MYTIPGMHTGVTGRLCSCFRTFITATPLPSCLFPTHTERTLTRTFSRRAAACRPGAEGEDHEKHIYCQRLAVAGT